MGTLGFLFYISFINTKCWCIRIEYDLLEIQVKGRWRQIARMRKNYWSKELASHDDCSLWPSHGYWSQPGLSGDRSIGPGQLMGPSSSDTPWVTLPSPSKETLSQKVKAMLLMPSTVILTFIFYIWKDIWMKSCLIYSPSILYPTINHWRTAIQTWNICGWLDIKKEYFAMCYNF